ncbi:heme ABC exporter ATP-binding protein CcmA [bacterium]|nr:heme ABC exporter ATP-binding protein CcmA [bacterium]
MPAALTVRGLGAARGYRILFEALDFDVGRGEIVELRGPNGSGKSTLLRVLAGLTRPMAGSITWADAAAGRSGGLARHYLGHADGVKPSEAAGEQARFWATFFARPPAVAVEALGEVGLADRADIPGRGLSAGQRRRLALARLLIEPRPVWLLDEPMAALDQQGQARVRRLAADHTARGGLIVAAMHGEGFAGARPIDLGAAA